MVLRLAGLGVINSGLMELSPHHKDYPTSSSFLSAQTIDISGDHRAFTNFHRDRIVKQNA